MHPKVLRVQRLNEELGEEQAKVIQQIEDAEKLESYEAFFKTEVIGRKTSYEEQETE